MSAARFLLVRSLRSGSGSPEGSVSGNIGDAYTRTSDGSMWVKTTGAGTNTGWTQAGGGGTVDLTTDVTGDLPLANLAPSAAASKLLARGDSGAGDWQPVTLGTNLSMAGTTLNASAGGGGGDVEGPASVVASEIALWDGTSGDLLKSATGTGIVRVTSGVYGTPGNVDLTSEVTNDLPFANLAQLAADKLAGRGNGGGTGDIQAITLGTNLSMSGTTLNAAGGGGGGMTLLEQHTASSSATLDFTTGITSTYDDYIVRIVNILPGTTNTDLVMQVSTDGGSTWETTNYEYVGTDNSTSNVGIGALNSASASSLLLFTGIDSAQGFGVTGAVDLHDPLSATMKKSMEFRVSAPFQGVSRRYTNAGSFFWGSTTAVNAIRFKFSSGNIASGTIRIYGLEK